MKSIDRQTDRDETEDALCVVNSVTRPAKRDPPFVAELREVGVRAGVHAWVNDGHALYNFAFSIVPLAPMRKISQ